MTPNPYDQACRYLLRLWAAPLLAWLLRLTPEQLVFVEWLDTRQVPCPGHSDRICDTVANLRDPEQDGLPWAAVVEFQIVPDELMFGRGLHYLGDLWQACKPTEHRGDRFEVGLVVVNLTGRGRASRKMHLRRTRVRTVLGVEERNLSTLSARTVLKQIEAKQAPHGLLAWVPLFKGGNRPGIIPKWHRLAEPEDNPEFRRSLGLAVLFAEAAGCAEMWRDALKEWDMVESKIVKEWQTQGKVSLLLDASRARFGNLPEDLVAKIRACTDSDKLRLWVEQLVKGPSLEEFRKLVNGG